MTEILRSLLTNLADVFRHFVPGCMVLAFAWISHPSWFRNLDLSKPAQFWIAAGASLLVGNITYVLHRTIIHQIVDFVISWRSPKAYVETVAKMIEKHFAVSQGMRNLMRLRNSQIIVTSILGELCFVVLIWHEPSSHAAAHQHLLLLTGILVFVGACCAHWVSHNLEQRLPTVPNPESK